MLKGQTDEKPIRIASYVTVTLNFEKEKYASTLFYDFKGKLYAWPSIFFY